MNEREVLSAYLELVGGLLELHIRPVLPESGAYKLTLLARVDGDPEADILVTQEPDLSKVMAAIRRGQAREAV